MKKIQLREGIYTIVDDADYDKLNQYPWRFGSGGYACFSRRTKGVFKTTLMHRLITNCPDGMLVDHIDHDKLNNTRSNLRLCNRAQNAANCKMRPDNTSGYRGVTWQKSLSKWKAQLKQGNKRLNLGYYVDIDDAANAYNLAATRYFGEFATLNEVKHL